MAFAFDEVFEGAAFAVLVDEVDVVVGFDHLHEVYHVDVVLEELQGFEFVAGQFREFVDLFELVEGDHFDCHFDAGVDVEGAVDFAVLSLAQVVGQRVVVDYFDHGNCRGNYQI
jgi:hypothetical protein